MKCPKCGFNIAIPLEIIFHGKKGTCPGCSCRILLSDEARCVTDLANEFGLAVGVLTNTDGKFETKTVKATKDLSGVTGSKKAVSQELYSQCWLVPISPGLVGVCFGSVQIAQLSKEHSTQFSKAMEGIENTTILGCTAKLISSIQSNCSDKWSVVLDVPFLQTPVLSPPPSIPIASVVGVVKDLRGKTPDSGPGFGIIRATLDEVRRFLVADADTAWGIRGASKQLPNGPRYYGDPEEILSDGIATWVDENWSVEVTLKVAGGNCKILEARYLSPNFHRCSRTQISGLRRPLEFQLLKP